MQRIFQVAHFTAYIIAATQQPVTAQLAALADRPAQRFARYIQQMRHLHHRCGEIVRTDQLPRFAQRSFHGQMQHQTQHRDFDRIQRQGFRHHMQVGIGRRPKARFTWAFRYLIVRRFGHGDRPLRRHIADGLPARIQQHPRYRLTLRRKRQFFRQTEGARNRI